MNELENLLEDKFSIRLADIDFSYLLDMRFKEPSGLFSGGYYYFVVVGGKAQANFTMPGGGPVYEDIEVMVEETAEDNIPIAFST